VVKFSQTYSKEVHELLAKQNPPLDPQLYGYEELPGWKLSVMETIEHTLHWARKATENQCSALRKALDVMKGSGLVHGDLRAPNVLIGGDNEVFIVDFEFSGKQGEVRLPYNIIAPEFKDVGAKGLGVITSELDSDMAGLLLKNSWQR